MENNTILYVVKDSNFHDNEDVRAVFTTEEQANYFVEYIDADIMTEIVQIPLNPFSELFEQKRKWFNIQINYYTEEPIKERRISFAQYKRSHLKEGVVKIDNYKYFTVEIEATTFEEAKEIAMLKLKERQKSHPEELDLRVNRIKYENKIRSNHLITPSLMSLLSGNTPSNLVDFNDGE